MRFEYGGREGFGTLDSDGQSIRVHVGDMFVDPRPSGEVILLSAARLLNPTRPGSFIGLWNNYRELAAKLNQAIPEEPLYFLKATACCLEPGGVIRKPAAYAGRVIYEGELGIIIGRRCSNLDEAEAAACIFGYTCINDVTALDILNQDPSFAQWTRAKSCDTFGPFGPVVASGLDWRSLRIRTLVDGSERQNYPASDMILPPARIVSAISRELTLLPGDVIACGTSGGAGKLKPGARVEVVIDGIGSLVNTFEESTFP